MKRAEACGERYVMSGVLLDYLIRSESRLVTDVGVQSRITGETAGVIDDGQK